jgi:hypothetical protein
MFVCSSPTNAGGVAVPVAIANSENWFLAFECVCKTHPPDEFVACFSHLDVTFPSFQRLPTQIVLDDPRSNVPKSVDARIMFIDRLYTGVTSNNTESVVTAPATPLNSINAATPIISFFIFFSPFAPWGLSLLPATCYLLSAIPHSTFHFQLPSHLPRLLIFIPFFLHLIAQSHSRFPLRQYRPY